MTFIPEFHPGFEVNLIAHYRPSLFWNVVYQTYGSSTRWFTSKEAAIKFIGEGFMVIEWEERTLPKNPEG